LIIAVVFGAVVLAVILGLGWSVGRIGIASLRNDHVERKDAIAAMFFIMSSVVIFFCLVTGFFFVWAML